MTERSAANKADIIIIGGGPVGSYTASLFSKAGYNVSIFEEHNKIGEPVSCTGLVTPAIKRFIKISSDFLVNQTNTIRVHAPNGSCFEVRKKEIVVDRMAFDQHLADIAQDCGASIHLSHCFVRREYKKAIVKDKNEKKLIYLQPKLIIGADGPASTVSQAYGLNSPRTYKVGIQALVKGSFDSDVYDVFFGKVAPGFFGWIVPETSKLARVGVATADNAKAHFSRLLKKTGHGKVLETHAGLIPDYNREAIVKKSMAILVGDAATHVKPTTGGGIVNGFAGAEELVRRAWDSRIIRNKNLRIDRNLLLHQLIRKTLDGFSEEDYNTLIRLCSKRNVIDTLERSDREFPLHLLVRLAVREPRLVFFINRIIKHKIRRKIKSV